MPTSWVTIFGSVYVKTKKGLVVADLVACGDYISTEPT